MLNLSIIKELLWRILQKHFSGLSGGSLKINSVSKLQYTAALSAVTKLNYWVSSISLPETEKGAM